MQGYNFNVFNLLIISGVIHGLIFSLIVLFKKKIKHNNYLAFTVLFLSLSNLQYFIIDINLTKLNPVLSYLFIPWQWLILPMFYLYVQKIIDKQEVSLKTKLLLISPFFIVLAIQACQVFYKFYINDLYIIPSHFKRGIYLYIEFFSFIFNISVILLSFWQIKSNENKVYNYKELKPETTWLKELIYIGLIICISWLIALLFVIIYNLNKSYVFYPMWIGISILVYWMGYIGLSKAQLLEERIALREKLESTFNLISVEKKTDNKTEIFNSLEFSIENQKLFLNPEINIESLGRELNIKAKFISESIKKNTEYNFNDYINSFRIAEVKKMLDNSDFSNYTIIAIGLEAGFNSKASFYRAFKKFEGITPREYLKK